MIKSLFYSRDRKISMNFLHRDRKTLNSFFFVFFSLRHNCNFLKIPCTLVMWHHSDMRQIMQKALFHAHIDSFLVISVFYDHHYSSTNRRDAITSYTALSCICSIGIFEKENMESQLLFYPRDGKKSHFPRIFVMQSSHIQHCVVFVQ